MQLIKLINSRYLLFTVLLYLILAFKLETTYSALYFLNTTEFIVYFAVLKSQLFKKDFFYTTNRLGWIIFGFGFFFIAANNIISFAYHQNYLVFSEADAAVYDIESLKMSSKSFGDAIDYFLKRWSLEDLGAVLVISTIYRVLVSNLMVNAFYLVLSIYTGLGIFKIGRYLMPIKYAYLSALAFSTASFYIWFNSSGLKESVMIFLVVYSFLHYYHFIKRKSLKYIFYAIPFLMTLLLFRPVVVFLIIGSVLISLIVGRKRSFVEFLVIVAVIIGIVIGADYLNEIVNRFIVGGGISQMIDIKEADGMVKGSVQFTYIVNILAGLIGPLPTILPNVKPHLSFYASGLIYKALISIPFWFGIYYMYKRNLYLYYPIALFVILESASLILILEGLELRKSMPHFPFIYIVSFGFMSYFDSANFLKPKRRKRIYNLLSTSFIIVFLLILYWNFRL